MIYFKSSNTNTTLNPFPPLQQYEDNMKANKQINLSHRLNNYYKYLIQKADSQEPVSFFKIIPIQSPSPSPKKKKRLEDSRTISYSEKKSARYIGKQPSKVEVEETSPRVKLPPINRKESIRFKQSLVLQRQESAIDWEKYYNVHHLETVNIDQGTIKLIQENQRKCKIKKMMSMDGKGQN